MKVLVSRRFRSEGIPLQHERDRRCLTCLGVAVRPLEQCSTSIWMAVPKAGCPSPEPSFVSREGVEFSRSHRTHQKPSNELSLPATAPAPH